MDVKVDQRYCCLEEGVHPVVRSAQCVKVIAIRGKEVDFITASDVGTLSRAQFERSFRKVDCYGCRALP